MQSTSSTSNLSKIKDTDKSLDSDENPSLDSTTEETKARQILTQRIKVPSTGDVTGIEISCEICHKVFNQYRPAIRHTREHSELEKFFCSICERPFYVKKDMQKHARSHEAFHLKKKKGYQARNRERKYICPTEGCDLRFYTLTNLKNHIARHSDERPYQCYACQNCFKRKGTLASHLKYHCAIKREKIDKGIWKC